MAAGCIARGPGVPSPLRRVTRTPKPEHPLNSTKIEKIETILWSRWLLIKIHCEDGTVGIGEAGVHGWQRPTETMIKTMEPYLLGIE